LQLQYGVHNYMVFSMELQIEPLLEVKTTITIKKNRNHYIINYYGYSITTTVILIMVGTYSHILQNAITLGRSSSFDNEERDDTPSKLTDLTVLEFDDQNAYHPI